MLKTLKHYLFFKNNYEDFLLKYIAMLSSHGSVFSALKVMTQIGLANMDLRFIIHFGMLGHHKMANYCVGLYSESMMHLKKSTGYVVFLYMAMLSNFGLGFSVFT